jgi:hypothetical protein
MNPSGLNLPFNCAFAPSSFVAMDVAWLLCDRFFRFVRIANQPLRIGLRTRTALMRRASMHESRHENDKPLA